MKNKKIRKLNKYLNIRVDDTFLKQLNYLCNRTGYKISKSDIIRRIVRDEYWCALDIDFRNE